MISNVRTLQLSGFFLFLIVITMPVLSMQKDSPELIQQLAQQQTMGNNYSTQPLQHITSNQTFGEISHLPYTIVSPEKQAQALAQKKIALRDKGTLFVVTGLAHIFHTYPDIKIVSAFLTYAALFLFLLEAFCNNPSLDYNKEK